MNFRDDGIEIHRGVLKGDLPGFIGRMVASNPWNPVEHYDQQETCNGLAARSEILDLIEPLVGPNIATYHARLLVKDKHARGAVPLHQDAPYHMGHSPKVVCFVALTEVDSYNGGIYVLPETHKLGLLGDGGHIDSDVLPGSWPNARAVNMSPGDVMLMDSRLWHGSFNHCSGPDRIIADIIYQDASDPSSEVLVRGSWPANRIVFNKSSLAGKELFKSSRVSRLKALQAKVDFYSGLGGLKPEDYT